MSRAVAVGDEVPPFVIDITHQRLVMEAAANRDFAPIHVDPDAARASGAPTAYANTTLIETLLEAAVRDWAGLGARIAVIDFAMLAFNSIGDRVTVAGVVRETTAAEDGLRAEVDVWMDAPHGRTVSGTATVVFP